MNLNDDSSGYAYPDAGQNGSHRYLLPSLAAIVEGLHPRPDRVFDLGCGNGSVAAWLTGLGFEVAGVDASSAGIRQARLHYPNLRLERGSAYDDLAGRYGRFPLVVSLEVVEHLYYPRRFAAALYDLVQDGGAAVVSTPYHGYWKNLALAVTGQLDAHFTALWDHGHIKFWSIKTLSLLLREAGFEDIRFHRAGRIPPLAKSMIAVARKAGR